MKAKSFGLALAVAALSAAACGEGRAIFNVDIYSFIQGTGSEILPFPPPPLPPLPPSFSVTVQNPPIGVKLPPGLSSSIVDTVRVTGSANVENLTSPGNLSFQIFFAKDSAPAILYAGTPAFTVGPQSVTAGAPTPLPFTADLSAAFRDLFKESELFIGIRATVTNTGAVGMQGRLRLTALSARVILQDKIF